MSRAPERVVIFRRDKRWCALGVDTNFYAESASIEDLYLASQKALGKPEAQYDLNMLESFWNDGLALEPCCVDGVMFSPRIVDQVDMLRLEVEMALHRGDGVDVQSDMLALLLIEEICFVTSWDEETRRWNNEIHISVLCSDTFAYACADAEHVRLDDIPALYAASKAPWGIVRWVAIRRNMRPLPSIQKRMRDAGAWDEAMEALPTRELRERILSIITS